MLKRHLAILTEYDGSCFHGWQEQKNVSSVQQCIREAWRSLTGEDLLFTGSSRTDAGVHALNHVCTFTTESSIPEIKIPLAINSVVKTGIAVKKCCVVQPDFDARFSAVGKLYLYDIKNSPIRNAIKRNYQAHVPGNLNLEAMHEACVYLVGDKDYRAFMDQGSAKRRTQRQIIRCKVFEKKDQHLQIEIAGDGFLYHMVRIMVGTLIAVGQGKMLPRSLPQLIADGYRPALGKTMPPEGLYLKTVYYPETIFGYDSLSDYLKLSQL